MKAKILIIEDNKEIAKLLGEALEEEGYQIELRENLAKAYAYLSTMPSLDLIVLDLILPDGDGLSILKYVRESQKYKNIPVVIISAKGQELDRSLVLSLEQMTMW